MTAEVHILSQGYLSDGGDRVGSTVGFDHTVNAALFPNARIHDHWA